MGNAFNPGRRSFYVTVALVSDPTKTVTAEVHFDADDIYEAGVGAELRHLGRQAEVLAGLRANADLSS